MRGRGWAAPAVAVGLLLGGCQLPGGGGTADAEPEPPAEVLTRLATTSHPAVCSNDYTDAGLEAVLGSSDLAQCEAAVKRNAPADAVEVSEVRVEGSRADARVALTGGSSAGLAFRVDLLLEDGRWRVDGQHDLEVVDRAAYDVAFRAAVEPVAEEMLPAGNVPCVQDRLEARTDDEIERMNAEGTVQAFLAEAVVDCVGSGSDLFALTFITQHSLSRSDQISRQQAACLAGASIEGMDGLTVEAVITTTEGRQQWHDAMLAAAKLDVC